MLTVKKIDLPDELADYKSDWERLLAVSDVNKIFLTYEWVRCWWQVFGKDHELYVLVVGENSRVDGIAPLMVTGRGRKKIIQFIGTPNSDYNDFIGARRDEVIERVLDYLDDHRSDWDLIDLAQIPEGSSSLGILSRLLETRRHSFTRKPIETVMAYEYTGPEGERGKFTLKKGSTFRRYQNFFKQLNGLSLERLRDRDEIRRILPAFFQSHITRWKSLPLKSKFHDERMRRFHEMLTDRLAPLKRISFMLLKHGRLPLAYLFAYDYNRSVHLYNIANESFHQKRSPGIIVLHFLTELFVRDGYKTIDFSRGAGEHKLRFINKSSTNFQVLIFKSRSAYFSALLKEKIKRILTVINLAGLTPKIALIKQHIKSRGLLKYMKHNITRMVQSIIAIRRFSLLTLNEKCSMELRPPLDLEVARLAAGDMESIANFYGILKDSNTHQAFEERFKMGDNCFAAIHDRQIVSILWGLYHEYSDKQSGLRLTPGHNEVILADYRTADLYRGQGLRAYLAARAADEYKTAGRGIIMAVTSADLPQFGELIGSKFKLLFHRRVVRILGRAIVV